MQRETSGQDLIIDRPPKPSSNEASLPGAPAPLVEALAVDRVLREEEGVMLLNVSWHLECRACLGAPDTT